MCQAGLSWGPCDGFCGYSELRNDCLLAFVTPLLFPFCNTYPNDSKIRTLTPNIPIGHSCLPDYNGLALPGPPSYLFGPLTLVPWIRFSTIFIAYYPTETWCTSTSVPFRCQKVVSGVGVISFVFVFSDFNRLDLHNKTRVAFANL